MLSLKIRTQTGTAHGCALSSQKGFLTVALLASLPLGLAIIALLSAAYLTLRTDNNLRHICRVELLRSQARVQSKLEALTSLNPQAQILRRDHDRQEELCELAEAPAAPPCLQLAITTAKQIKLAAQQRALIAAAQLESKTGPAKAAANVGLESTHQSRPTWLKSRPEKVGQFPLEASPETSLTPDYNPSSSFEDDQTMRVEWTVGLASLLPAWLKEILPLSSLNLRASCGATLTKAINKSSPNAVSKAASKALSKALPKEGGKWKSDSWQPILSADKS